MDVNLKALKSSKISFSQADAFPLNYSQEEIKKIVPHRDPFLLLDSIDALSLTESVIQGERLIDGNDPIFKGHFPSNPVYPGVLQIEMMGQMGLCLTYFLKNQTHLIDETQPQVKGLFTRVRDTLFLSGIFPGDRVKILAKALFYDEFLGSIACQVVKADKICSLGILEVYFE